MAWKFRWLDSWDAIWSGEIQTLWLSAFRPDSGAHATPFGHPEIVRAWVETVGAETVEPLLGIARHPDGRTVLLPLVRPLTHWSFRLHRTFTSAGIELFDYQEPIVLPGKRAPATLGAGFWRDLASALLRGRGAPRIDRLTLSRLRADILAGGTATGRSTAILRLAPYRDLEDYLQSRSSKLRAGLRRAERRLAEKGAVTFTVHDASESEAVLAWLPRFLQERDARHATRASEVDPGLYFANLLRRGLGSGLVHASSLALDGEPISWEINLQSRGTLYGYSCAFDPRFAEYSPGSLHKLRLVGWLLETGGTAFDFMRGGEAYKRRWTDGEEQHLGSFTLRPDTLESRLRRRAGEGALRLSGIGSRRPQARPSADGARA